MDGRARWKRNGAIALEIGIDLVIAFVLVETSIRSFSFEGATRFVALGASALFALAVIALGSTRRPFATSSFGFAIVTSLVLGFALTNAQGTVSFGPKGLDAHRMVAPLIALEIVGGTIVVALAARRVLRRLPLALDALLAVPFLSAAGWFVSRPFLAPEPARLLSGVGSLPWFAQPGFVAALFLLPSLALAVLVCAIARRAGFVRDLGVALALVLPAAFALVVGNARSEFPLGPTARAALARVPVAPCWIGQPASPAPIVPAVLPRATDPTSSTTPAPTLAPHDPAPVVATAPDPMPAPTSAPEPVKPAPPTKLERPVARFEATVTVPADLRGFDLAAPSLGGRLVRISSRGLSRRATPEKLIEAAFDPRWIVESASLPQSFVVGFRESTIDRVVLDTRWYDWGEEARYEAGGRVREIELAREDRTSLGVFTIPARGRFVTLRFAPMVASALEVRIRSNVGGGFTGLRTVHVIEAEGGAALAGTDLDLAKLDVGGEVVRFTSQDEDAQAWRVTDGTTRGWVSGSSDLPQDLVVAMPNEAAALVSAIELTPATDRADDERPREVRVLASTASPIDGFREIGHATFGREGLWSIAIEPAAAARWIQIRIVSNHGGSRTSLGELRILEARQTGYRSVLAGGGLVLPETSLSADGAAVTSEGLVEHEPNDSLASANPLPLETTLQGRIEPRGEQDVYAIDVPADARGKVLELAIEQAPLRTSVTLLDAEGKPLAGIDPSETKGARGSLTWLATGARYYARVTEPRSSVVLVWDLSGSMIPTTPTLEKVLRSWVAKVEPSEEVALVSFQRNSVDVRCGFTSDRERLARALDGAFAADGNTPLYDALQRAIDLLKDRRGNRAIVLMTDGGDNASTLSPPALWETLERERIRTTTVSLGPELGMLVNRQGCDGGRFLSSVARATGGLSFHAEEASELEPIYDAVARELRRSTPYRLRVERARAGRFAIDDRRDPSERWGGPRRIEFILDGSASMDEPVGGFRREVSDHDGTTTATLVPNGPRKIEAAREAFGEMLASLPEGTEVALRAYGFSSRRAGDTRLLVPFGALDRARLSRIARTIVPAGNTPIAASLAQVPDDFGRRGGERMVVLISDGKETCGGDPAGEARRLVREGFAVKVHVVGFDLRGEEANAVDQLRAIANATGGRFFQADDRDALRSALLTVVRTEWHLEDVTGGVVARGVLGEPAPAEVPAGTYKLVVERTPALAFERVTIRSVKTTRFVLSGEGARVRGGVAEEGKE
jgi:Mg-chelatase subunit ChlD